MYRIAAYITAYEDADAVISCIAAINNQSYPVEKILIIDNSKVCLSKLIKEQNNLLWDHHPENIGIAQGLNIGIAWAITEKYDFLWTFDQDSEPKPDALASLLQTQQKLKQNQISLGIIACIPIDIKTQYKLHGLVFDCYKFVTVSPLKQNSNYYECDLVITSGSLIVVEAAQNIPKIDNRLFIDTVDWDLCLKFKQCGYKIYIDCQAVLYHNYGNSYKITLPLIKRQLTLSNYSPLRYYYMTRNQTFIETRYAAMYRTAFFTLIYRLINSFKKIIKIVLFDRQEMPSKIYAVIKGTWQGVIGNLNK